MLFDPKNLPKDEDLEIEYEEGKRIKIVDMTEELAKKILCSLIKREMARHMVHAHIIEMLISNDQPEEETPIASFVPGTGAMN